MRIFLALVISVTTTFAFAQQQQTPTEQAMGTKILQEMQAGLTCSVSLISVKDELDKANARIKELEPKKDEAK